MAQAVMMGPLHSIARYLPTTTRDFARSIEHLLPADFSMEIYDQLIQET